MRRAAATLMLAATAMASPALRLEGGPFLPFRLNRAVARDAAGLSGRLELTGLRWDGSRVPLARIEGSARSQVVDLLFYLDEDIRALELTTEEQEPLRVDLALPEGGTTAAEGRLRSRMRALDPPVRLSPDGAAPERFSFQGTDLVMAGFQASSSLFGVAVNGLPVMVLAGYVVLVLAAGSMPAGSGTQRLVLPAVRILAACGAVATVLWVARPRATLFTVAFSADTSGARVSGILERRVESAQGYTRITYASGQSEGAAAPSRVWLIGLWTPSGQGIPVAEVVPPDALVRLSSPPLIVGTDADWHFLSNSFVTGWVVREEP